VSEKHVKKRRKKEKVDSLSFVYLRGLGVDGLRGGPDLGGGLKEKEKEKI
jgi:hypothetical protein